MLRCVLHVRYTALSFVSARFGSSKPLPSLHPLPLLRADEGMRAHGAVFRAELRVAFLQHALAALAGLLGFCLRMAE